jgi:protein gp37
MSRDTLIPWCHATFNPWQGCSRVSPGCERCYAEVLGKRFGIPWGPGAERKLARDAYWEQPLRWDRQAEKTGQRLRVFCGSMCDVFDAAVPDGWRSRLWALIAKTPHLDWMLLTKRPQYLRHSDGSPLLLPPDWDGGHWTNVWLGCTVEDQPRADERLDLLMNATPRRGRGAILFASCEPLLEELDLSRWLDGAGGCLDLVIVGAEKLPGKRPGRPCREEWVRNIRAQVVGSGVALFVKQLEREGKIVEMPLVDNDLWDEMPPSLPIEVQP